MAEPNEDPAKPLSPLSLTTRSDQPNEDHYHHDRTKYVHSPSKLILCCGFVASLTMLIAVTFIVLSLTVFHLRNPHLTVDSISFIQPLDEVNGQVNTNRNVTVSVEISLRNPNPTTFRVENATVLIYHGESLVVESSRRSETISAKRTVKMNLTAEIVITKLIASVPGFMEDFNGRGVDLRSSVVVIGKVKIIKIFKKSVHLQTDCFMKMMTTNNSLKPTFQCSRKGNT